MTDWTKKKYDEYYNSYVPWLEDKYLAWFGENKTSYTAKDQLDKTKLTSDPSLNAVQDGVNTGVAGQFKSDGLLGGVGDLVSKEGVNRAERGDSGLGEKELQAKAAEEGKREKGWGESIPGAGWVMGGKK
ncbi:MAG: hypothetical protein L6R40_007102 [Gallowayella cf. fulva]|nr:MAG: hypothetical protein L6R40_007102 [Xanthomendoza cf. fulva]